MPRLAAFNRYSYLLCGWPEIGDLGDVMLGGLLFALGLGSRLIALLLVVDMAVAYVAADRDALMSIFSDPNKFYDAAPYTFLVAALIVLIFGPGKYSLDALLAKRFSATASNPRASSHA